MFTRIPSVHRIAGRIGLGVAAVVLTLALAFGTAHAASPHVEDWTGQQVVDPQGLGYDHLGGSVAISGSIALVSATEATLGDESSQGKVLVYERGPDGVWNETQTLVASDGAAYNEFGWSLAIRGDLAVIGAINASIDGNLSQGAAYVFVRGDDGQWTETQKLVADDGQPVDWFGSAYESERPLSKTSTPMPANDRSSSAETLSRAGAAASGSIRAETSILASATFASSSTRCRPARETALE